MTGDIKRDFEVDYSKYDFKDPEVYVYRTPKGLTEDVIREISAIKEEPSWMLEFRLKAYKYFLNRPTPTWGADLSGINYDEIIYYIRPSKGQANRWEDVPAYIKKNL